MTQLQCALTILSKRSPACSKNYNHRVVQENKYGDERRNKMPQFDKGPRHLIATLKDPTLQRAFDQVKQQGRQGRTVADQHYMGARTTHPNSM
eukprot:3490242-Amphidinium_carterae.1